MDCRMLLFDLDGTLLRSDRSISQRTLQILDEYRKRGVLIGIATSRSESNSQQCIQQVTPDIEITCSGALVKYRGNCVYKAEFTPEETKRLIQRAGEICGSDTEITVDTINKPSMPYANKILERWFADGYKTVADVDNAMDEYKRKKNDGSSFDVNEFFEAALRRTYGE